MAMNLASRESDLESNNTLAILGKESFDFLFPERNPLNDPIIPKEVEWGFEPLSVDAPANEPTSDLILHPALDKVPENLGSNNWAVAGSKTASGHPILCSDPHLMLSLPATWYELQIKVPEFNCYGVCLPGFPGITIGFNEHIAWGMTNVQHDVLDWYKINWVDERKEQYWLDGEKAVSYTHLTLPTILLV